MKQTKLNAIMRAQVILTTCAMAGYHTTMSIGRENSTKEITVTIFYDKFIDWEIIKSIILLNKNKEEKIEGTDNEGYKWITYTTYYE